MVPVLQVWPGQAAQGLGPAPARTGTEASALGARCAWPALGLAVRMRPLSEGAATASALAGVSKPASALRTPGWARAPPSRAQRRCTPSPSPPGRAARCGGTSGHIRSTHLIRRNAVGVSLDCGCRLSLPSPGVEPCLAPPDPVIRRDGLHGLVPWSGTCFPMEQCLHTSGRP